MNPRIVLLLAAFSSLHAGTITVNLQWTNILPAGCVCAVDPVTNVFSWGATTGPGGTASTISFAPRMNVDVGAVTAPVTFTIGTLTISNGVTYGGEATSVTGHPSPFTFGFPAGASFIIDDYNAVLTNTPNLTGDPVLDSDFYSVSSFGGDKAFGIPEGATSSVDLMGQLSPVTVMGISTTALQYSFRVVGFANPTGGGFLLADVPTPEANTSFLLLCGMAVLAVRSWTLRRSGPNKP